MAEPLVLGGTVVALVLLFLRFGDAVCEFICRTIDPAPDIIEENQP